MNTAARRQSIRTTPGLDPSLATEENLLAFNAILARVNREQQVIFDACADDCRFLTEDEQRRYDELSAEYELARAAFERTLTPASQ